MHGLSKAILIAGILLMHSVSTAGAQEKDPTFAAVPSDCVGRFPTADYVALEIRAEILRDDFTVSGVEFPWKQRFRGYVTPQARGYFQELADKSRRQGLAIFVATRNPARQVTGFEVSYLFASRLRGSESCSVIPVVPLSIAVTKLPATVVDRFSKIILTGRGPSTPYNRSVFLGLLLAHQAAGPPSRLEPPTRLSAEDDQVVEISAVLAEQLESAVIQKHVDHYRRSLPHEAEISRPERNLKFSAW